MEPPGPPGRQPGGLVLLLAFQDHPWTEPSSSPLVLDMERLIQEMMSWAGVTESRLEAEGEISTEFGETLSWPYLQYVRAHPVSRWETPTPHPLGPKDHLVPRDTVDRFCPPLPLLPDCGGGDGALVPYPGTAGGSEAVEEAST